MSFDEVFYSMKTGAWVRRKVWTQGVCIILRGKCLVEHWANGLERPATHLLAKDILEDDWEIVDPQ